MRRFKPVLLIAGIAAFGVAYAIGNVCSEAFDDSLAGDTMKDRCLG